VRYAASFVAFWDRMICEPWGCISFPRNGLVQAGPM
jgi:hypothetical protein